MYKKDAFTILQEINLQVAKKCSPKVKKKASTKHQKNDPLKEKDNWGEDMCPHPSQATKSSQVLKNQTKKKIIQRASNNHAQT